MRKSSKKKPNDYRLPKPQRKVLEYWYDSLKQGQRTSVSLQASDLQSFSTDSASIGTGRLEVERFSRFVAQGSKSQRRGAMSFDKNGEIRVLVCPVAYHRKGAKNSAELYAPLWVPAVVNESGKLTRPNDVLPWIPRQHLEPVVNDSVSLVLGEVFEFEQYFENNVLPESNDWNSYWNYAQEMFKHVCGEGVATLDIPEFERTPSSIIVLDEAVRGAYIHIQRHYERLLKSKVDYRLFAKLAEPKVVKRHVYKRSRQDAGKASAQHVAHFNSSFPLSYSQRLALHRVLTSEAGDILCVSGPPGTGKTTLIQAVVVNFWVEAAAAGRETPPVVLACGETNQSVTNIIESFAPSDPKDTRWLPKVNSFGSYCCSKQRWKTSEGIQCEVSSGEGFSSQIENLKFLEEAEARYIKCAAKALGKKTSLVNVLRKLRKELNAELAKMRKDIREIPAGGFWNSFSENRGRGDYGMYREYYRALSRYDTNRRYKAFQLATHYWEGQWLLRMRSELKKRAAEKDLELRFRNSAADWRRRAMLTPVFVSTFSMAPRFFYSNHASFKANPSDSAPADLLIVDEAGKSTPETAAPTFSFAERALVVGDKAQLEPVWNVSSHYDREALRKFGLLSMLDQEQLNKRGLMTSSGDLMTLAFGACTGIEEGKHGSTVGGFLTEHRRSVPDIIAFCNRLCYAGRLVPKRSDISERKFPALGYYHIRGVGEKVGSSRRNLEEANKIEEWLAMNERLIATFYKTNRLDKHVAVITPFFSQARLLEQKLLRTYPELVIGTVGSLQGAEREIVIFSPVYDRDFKGDYFFDKTPNHLNVAVSRAKDSFLVFADMSIFNPKSRTPSGELARFLLRSDDQNLAKKEQEMAKAK